MQHVGMPAIIATCCVQFLNATIAHETMTLERNDPTRLPNAVLLRRKSGIK